MKILLTILITVFTITVYGQKEQQQRLTEFLPEGYMIFETIYGDLNKDGLVDCILIIKGTDKSKIIIDEYRGKLDRNRRGMLILINRMGKYELAVKNQDCFSSENEDGGVYFAPELFIAIKNGKLLVSYGHGRYGYWSYTFRYQNADLDLIGYDESSNRGPVIRSMTSINFLTKKKQVKVNMNQDGADEEEVFKETWKNIKINRLVKLSEIKDFNELDMTY